MATGCELIPAVDGFVSGMIGFVDCQAATLGIRGYQALAAPGSSAALLMTALLTIFIAVFGFRMLSGHAPTIHESVLVFLKVGVVLAFATSWSAYRTVVYDVALREPADIVAEIGGPAGLPGTAGGLTSRLDGLDHAFQTLAIFGLGVPTKDQVDVANGVSPPLFAGFDTFALGASRAVFLISSVSVFALVRLGAGLLLALAPLFLGFLLFEGTRGLIEGWMKALISTALGSVAAAIVLGTELALFEPWLADLLARRAAGVAIPGASTPVFAAAVMFAIVLFGLLALMTRVTFSLSMPTFTRPKAATYGRLSQTVEPSSHTVSRGAAIQAEQRSRAAMIVDGVSAAQRREQHGYTTGLQRGSVGATTGGGRSDVGATSSASYAKKGSNRRVTTRVSAGADARDRRV